MQQYTMNTFIVPKKQTQPQRDNTTKSKKEKKEKTGHQQPLAAQLTAHVIKLVMQLDTSIRQ